MRISGLTIHGLSLMFGLKDVEMLDEDHGVSTSHFAGYCNVRVGWSTVVKNSPISSSVTSQHEVIPAIGQIST